MISVILLIYNNDLQDIYMTLNSILEQDFKDFEIVVADDKSSISYEKEIEEYFFNNNFTNFQFVFNTMNLGTVKNYLNALRSAKGQYIKPISPGDLLYEKTTLGKINNFICKSNCLFGFGKMYAYKKNEKYICNEFKAPKDRTPYYYKNYKKIRKNIILYGDFISGACMFACKKELIAELEYLSSVGKVRYCEDYIQIQLALKNKFFEFLDEPIVFYEYGQGISTKITSKKEKSKVQIDFENYIDALRKQYSDSLLYKRYKLNCYNEMCLVKKIFLKFITSPGLYWFTCNKKHKL